MFILIIVYYFIKYLIHDSISAEGWDKFGYLDEQYL